MVVCIWRRPHRLQRTIESLVAQSHGIKLCLWNNNPALRELVDASTARISEIDVDVVHSTRNVGGFGRFYLARRLASSHPHVVFLDDDQIPAPDFVETLVDEFRTETVWSAYAYRFLGTTRYSDRTPAKPGERAKYCGTRGMICDSRVFLQPDVFGCPRRFWFVEDLWLSYYADHVLGWPLLKSAANIATEPDEHDQHRLMGPAKDRFFRHLVARGWNPVLADEAEVD